MLNNVDKIKESHLCYGCGTCGVVCNVGAITMKYDNIGRLLPQIDETLCTNCGLCSKICPSVDEKGIQLPQTDDLYFGNVIETFIGKSNDEKIYRNAQSGGMVTSVLKYLFESGQIDAAVCCRTEFAKDYTAKAVVIKAVEELYDCQKSSYIPLDIVSAAKELKSFNSVAVVGTGCHIQGFKALENFKKNIQEKIFVKLGLICDRTLCKTVTNVLYSDFSKESKLIWRDKTENYKNACLIQQYINGNKKELPRWHRFVLKDPFTNPRCRICFDKLNVNADIVFGDPWGMNNVDWQNGMSVFVTRTQKGQAIISEMSHNNIISLQNAPFEEVVIGQHISKRRIMVSSGLKYYKEKGWCIPSYGDKLIVAENDENISKKIEEFIKDSKKTKQEIIQKNKRFLLKKAGKEYVKKVISFIIKHIKK